MAQTLCAVIKKNYIAGIAWCSIASHKISNNCKNLNQTNCKMVYPTRSWQSLVPLVFGVQSSVFSPHGPWPNGPKCALKITKFSYATFEPAKPESWPMLLANKLLGIQLALRFRQAVGNGYGLGFGLAGLASLLKDRKAKSKQPSSQATNRPTIDCGPFLPLLGASCCAIVCHSQCIYPAITANWVVHKTLRAKTLRQLLTFASKLISKY